MNYNAISSSRWLAPILISGASLFYGIWKFSFTIPNLGDPLMLKNDHLLYAVNTQNFINFLHVKPSVFGAPIGQDLSFALVSVDSLAPLLAALLSFDGNPFLGMNLVLLMGFPLTAITAFWSLQYLGIRAWIASLGSLMIAVAPFHVMWGLGSLTIASYFLLTPSVVLLITIWSGRTSIDGIMRSNRSTTKFIGIALFLVLVGAHYSYWSLGLTMLALLSLIFSGILKPDKTKILSVFGYSFFIMIGFLISAIDSIAATFDSDVTLESRSPIAAMLNSSTLISVVLPADGTLTDRLLSSFVSEYDALKIGLREFWISRDFAGEAYYANSGVPLALILIALIGLAFHNIFSKRLDATRGDELRATSSLLVLSFILSSTGGIGALVALSISSSLRGYSRYTIFITILLVVIACIFAESSTTQTPKITPVLIFLLIFSVLDSVFIYSPISHERNQTLSVSRFSGEDVTLRVPSDQLVDELSSLDERMFRDFGKCPSLVLPIMAYPYEAPGYSHYRLLAPGLVGGSAMWSAGATEGSPSWQLLSDLRQEVDAKKPIDEIFSADEFCSILIDVTTWEDMRDFKPWAEYSNHPLLSLEEFVDYSSSYGEWQHIITSYGDYLVLDIRALNSSAIDRRLTQSQ